MNAMRAARPLIGCAVDETPFWLFCFDIHIVLGNDMRVLLAAPAGSLDCAKKV